MAAALAHPPFGLLPGVFGYALVLAALDLPTPTVRRGWPAFARGWAAGAGYLLVSTMWIVEPFMIDAQAHAWQAPLAVFAVAGGIGAFWGAAGWLYARLTPAPGPGGDPRRAGLAAAARIAAFAAAFGLAEWLRGHVLTGFPWDLPGETWRAGSPLSQGAALFGAYGLTLATLAFGAAPAVLAMRGEPGKRMGVALAALASLAAAGGWGAWRLAHAPTPIPGAVRLRVVQPDLPEPTGWSPALVQTALDLYTGLSRAPAADGRRPDVALWPEGAIPDAFEAWLQPGSAQAAQVAAAFSPGQQLLTGGYRGQSPDRAGGPALYFNSLLALRREPAGLVVEGTYDKHHLVPFGEYLPAPWLFGALGLRRFVSVPTDFTPGPPPHSLETPLPGGGILRFQPLICYEALFPGIAEHSLSARAGGRRPSLLVNVSDDAWFGRFSGPWQHLNIASYRAIEEGLPMVRATPTGVSAIIDAMGRPVAAAGGGPALLAPGRKGVVDADLPPALRSTPYARWRDLPFWAAELALASLALTLRRARVRDRRSI